MTEANMAQQIVALGAVLLIRQNFGLAREAVRPGVAGFEREGVQVRRHITGRAGIGVVAPDAAQGALFLEDREVFKARQLEVMGHAQPPETGADDGHSGSNGVTFSF